MSTQNLRVTVKRRGFPLSRTLVPAPVVCFVGALLTDLAYWRTADMQWANFSIWLLTAGLVMAGITVLVALIDLVAGRRSADRRPVWPRVLGAALVMGLSLINAFVHSRDAYTSVVPTGLALSGLVVLILLVTGWMSRPRTDVDQIEMVQ